MEPLLSSIALFGIAIARPIAVMLILPVFTRLGLTGFLRVGVALALSLPVVAHLGGDMQAIRAMNTPVLIAMLLKEVAIGFLLGLLFGIPFWAAQSAGDIIDTQRGSSIAYMTDPTALAEVSIIGTLLELMMVALFLAGGGADLVTGAIYQSEQLWPLMAPFPEIASQSGDLLLGILDKVMRGAILFSGPIVIILFIVEVVMALISRMSSQLQMSDLSLPIKNIAVFVALPIYVLFFIEQARHTLDDLRHVLPDLERFLH